MQFMAPQCTYVMWYMASYICQLGMHSQIRISYYTSNNYVCQPAISSALLLKYIVANLANVIYIIICNKLNYVVLFFKKFEVF